MNPNISVKNNLHIQNFLWTVVLFFGLFPIAQAQIEDTTYPVGYAILIQGSLTNHKGSEAYNKTLNRVYRRLLDRGFIPDNIRYFNFGDNQDSVYIIPSEIAIKKDIKNSIETWAVDKINTLPAPLYIIMVDHGNPDQFFLYDEDIKASELKDWLEELEGNLFANAQEQPRIIVIGSCYSGSFIDELSKSGRIIVTSAAPNELSYKGLQELDGIRSGEFFIEEFFNQLWRGYSLTAAFEKATTTTDIFTRRDLLSSNTTNKYLDNAMQHPLLDDNGDGKGEHALSIGGDGQIANSIFLGVDLKAHTDVADIVEVTPPVYLEENEDSAQLFLKVNDPKKVGFAQIAIRPSSKTLEKQGSFGQISIDLETLPLTYNNDKNQFEVEYDKFTTESGGKYEICYLIRDKETQYISLMQRSVVYKNKYGNSPPKPFELKTPEHNSQTRTVLVFDWEPSTDPDGDLITYNLFIAEDKDFTNIVNDRHKDTSEITASIVGVDDNLSLQDGKKYFWKVEAVDSFGAKTVSDEVRNFKVREIFNDIYTPVNASIIDNATHKPVLDANIEVKSIKLPSGEIISGKHIYEYLPSFDVVADEESGDYFFGFPIYGQYKLAIDALDYFFFTEYLEIESQFSTRKTDRKISPQSIIKKHIFLTPCQNVPCYASGIILDKFDEPMADVLVTVDDRTTKTNEEGYWKINGLRGNEYEATAHKEGYIFSAKKCSIGNGEGCHPDFNAPDSELHLKVIAKQYVEQGDDLFCGSLYGDLVGPCLYLHPEWFRFGNE